MVYTSYIKLLQLKYKPETLKVPHIYRSYSQWNKNREIFTYLIANCIFCLFEFYFSNN